MASSEVGQGTTVAGENVLIENKCRLRKPQPEQSLSIRSIHLPNETGTTILANVALVVEGGSYATSPKIVRNLEIQAGKVGVENPSCVLPPGATLVTDSEALDYTVTGIYE